LAGEIEVDESYFGSVRKGKRGRAASCKDYAKVPPDKKSKTFDGNHTRLDSFPDSIVYSDWYYSYNLLVVSEFEHYKINHSKLFADKQNHINGIENFWSQTKRHMHRFKGIPVKHFPIFLKECVSGDLITPTKKINKTT
jgi:transposase